jgi:hypothetical protein
MTKFKKVLRYIGLALLILLALTGIGMMTHIRPREQDYENETKTELVEGEASELGDKT